MHSIYKEIAGSTYLVAYPTICLIIRRSVTISGIGALMANSWLVSLVTMMRYFREPDTNSELLLTL